jgi:fructokinase
MARYCHMTTQLGHYIGLDLGGTKTEVAVLDAQNTFLMRERMPTPRHDYQAIMDTIVGLVGLAKQRFGLGPSHPVGLGIPGCVDPVTHLVRGANTRALNGKPLQHDLAQALNCPVRVENDANCLALSESWDGAAQGTRVAFAAILGTGCGAGITLGTQIWKGRNALAGEWGHNPLPWPTQEERLAPNCWCGLQGCIETWISGTGIAADYARLTHENARAEAIVESMRGGEKAAMDIWRRYVDRLGRSLAQVINLLDPDVIVLGGGMSRIENLYPEVAAAMAPYTFHRPVTTPVRQAVHGDSSGVRGAAWLNRV